MTRGGLHPAAACAVATLSPRDGGLKCPSILFLPLVEGEGREGVVGIAVTLAAKTESRHEAIPPFLEKTPSLPSPCRQGEEGLGCGFVGLPVGGLFACRRLRAR